MTENLTPEEDQLVEAELDEVELDEENLTEDEADEAEDFTEDEADEAEDLNDLEAAAESAAQAAYDASPRASDDAAILAERDEAVAQAAADHARETVRTGPIGAAFRKQERKNAAAQDNSPEDESEVESFDESGVEPLAETVSDEDLPAPTPTGGKSLQAQTDAREKSEDLNP